MPRHRTLHYDGDVEATTYAAMAPTKSCCARRALPLVLASSAAHMQSHAHMLHAYSSCARICARAHTACIHTPASSVRPSSLCSPACHARRPPRSMHARKLARTVPRTHARTLRAACTHASSHAKCHERTHACAAHPATASSPRQVPVLCFLVSTGSYRRGTT